MSIEREVGDYLSQTTRLYQPGQHEYYARLALEQAVEAYKQGDYGIGAIGVLATETTVSEFPGRNVMMTGDGVVDHAETRALIAIRSGKEPSNTYGKQDNEWTKRLPIGISMFGTLEPCPMCVITLSSVGAKLSISTIEDGVLVESDGIRISGGAATVIGEKGKLQPKVWQEIQARSGIVFELLETNDEQLKDLSRRVFEDNRAKIDVDISNRPARK